MGPFAIASLIATIAGAAIQYRAQQAAQRRQQEEIQRSLDNQELLQRQAEQKAMDTAKKFAPEDRKAEQQTIETQLTQELMNPVSESQNIRSQQQTTQGNVSNDYTTAKAKSDLSTLKSTEALARLLGKTTSANRLRMNEGINLMDAGQSIDQLANFSRGQAGADQIAINQAGMVSPGATLAGSLLQGAGTAGLMSSGGGIADKFNSWFTPKSGIDFSKAMPGGPGIVLK